MTSVRNVVGWLFISLSVLVMPAGVLSAQVLITGVMCNPVGTDTNNEYVLIKNTATAPITIHGWKIDTGEKSKHGIADTTIQPGETIAIINSSVASVDGYNAVKSAIKLANTHDSVELIDNTDTSVHSIEYDNTADEGELCFTFNPPEGGVPTQSGTTTSTSTASTTSNTSSSTTQIVQHNIVTTVLNKTYEKFKYVSVEPPEDIFVRQVEPFVTAVGSVVYLIPEIYDARGKLVRARCTIAWGDGESTDGCDGSHIYERSGTYVLSVDAVSGTLRGEMRTSVTVVEPSIALLRAGDDDGTLSLQNFSTEIDLSGWEIRAGRCKYTLPHGTIIAERATTPLARAVLSELERCDNVPELYDMLGTVRARATSTASSSVAQAESSSSSTANAHMREGTTTGTESVATTTEHAQGTTTAPYTQSHLHVHKQSAPRRATAPHITNTIIGRRVSELTSLTSSHKPSPSTVTEPATVQERPAAHGQQSGEQPSSRQPSTERTQQASVLNAGILPTGAWWWALLGLLVVAVLPYVLVRFFPSGDAESADTLTERRGPGDDFTIEQMR